MFSRFLSGQADPPDDLDGLTVALLKRWIDQGAPYAQHWAYVKPVRSPVPAVSDPAWPINAIDHFILARLQREGLKPTPPADRHAILRRLSLDLTGLPPTLADIDQFIQDRSPDVRAAGESALLAIREDVRSDLEKVAKSGRLSGPAALAVERVLATLRPLVGWKVIGPFPRTTPAVFLGERSIDFERSHSGPEGRKISWTARQGQPATGRVVLRSSGMATLRT